MPLFADLDRLRADLDALRPLAPEQEARVLQKFRLEWNYNSNAIEGNSLTLGETRSLLLHGLTAAGKPMRDHLDIKGHNEAVVALEEFVRSEYPLTEQFIREMHQLLLGEPYHTPAQTASGQPTRKLIVPGQYKTSPNNVLTATGEMFYFASPEETPARMTDLVDWYRAEEAAPTLPPVALAAEFHYRFVRIHPFDDGNGRMSRLLMNLILLRHGYPMTVIQAADRNRYLAALADADAGEPAPFLRFIIENVEASLRLMIRAARGESIDEPSDLDKKWILLKKQILEFKTSPSIDWTLTTQNDFHTFFIAHWLTNLLVSVRPVDEFFANNQSYFTYLSTDSIPKPEAAYNASVVDNTRVLFRTSKKLIKSVAYIFKWLEFLQLKNQFSFQVTVRIDFSSTKFKIFYSIEKIIPKEYNYWPSILNFKPFIRFESILENNIWQELFSSTYKSNYEYIQIHDINHQLVNKLYDFIAAEADTPPA